MDWGDFFSFKKMVSSTIVKFIYILGVIFITFSSFAAMFATRGFLYGLFMLVLGNLLWRVFCEGIIILFSIHERLVSIEKNISKES
jgi:hypothetical protein